MFVFGWVDWSTAICMSQTSAAIAHCGHCWIGCRLQKVQHRVAGVRMRCSAPDAWVAVLRCVYWRFGVYAVFVLLPLQLPHD